MCNLDDFVIENGILKKYIGSGGDVEIPEGITEIGFNAFNKVQDLESVILPSGLLTIGRFAFDRCNNLSNIAFPDGLLEIGEAAFSGCGKLQKMYLPASLEKISYDAFPVDGYVSLFRSSIAELEDIEVDPQNKYFCSVDGVLYNKDKTVLIKMPPNYAVQKFSVPEGTITIGADAFKNCENLQEIIFPSSLKVIDSGAFENVPLQSIHIPANVMEIGDSAFYRCKLTTVQLEDGLHSIGAHAFSSQRSVVQSVEVPKTVISLGKCAFGNVNAITVFDTITSDAKPCEEYIDPDNGFCNSKVGFIGLAISRGVIGCAADAFWDKPHTIIVRSAETGQEKYRVKMPAKQERKVYCTYTSSWGRNAEFNFPAIDAIFGELTSEEKQEYALYRMHYSTGLSDEHREVMKKYLKRTGKPLIREIVRKNDAENLKLLDSFGFIKKDELDELLKVAEESKSIECKAYLMQWGEQHISKKDRETKSKKETSFKPPTASELKKLWSYTTLDDGTLKLTNYKGMEQTVIVPERIGNALVTEIDSETFAPRRILGKAREPEQRLAMEALSSVLLPDSIRHVEDGAFCGCKGLADENGMVIVKNVLHYCVAQGDVVIPEGVIRIAKHAFYSPGSFGNNTLCSVVLPDSLKSIGRWAFDGCKALTHIKLPSHRINIEESAFDGCDNLADNDGYIILDGTLYEFINKTKAESITIPDGVVRIADGAFYDDSFLKEIDIPDSVTELQGNPFQSCHGLGNSKKFVLFRDTVFGYFGRNSSPAFPKNIKSVASYSFCWNNHVEDIDLPDSVTSIESHAFVHCKNLKLISIPAQALVADDAFENCPNLQIKRR